MSQSEPFKALAQGSRFNCVLKNSCLTLNMTPEALFLEQINRNAIKSCLKRAGIVDCKYLKRQTHCIANIQLFRNPHTAIFFIITIKAHIKSSSSIDTN